ncbi:putative isoleucyl-tRNA synthetase [Selenomonas ruminantium subsp. lactilytica TAM6421]|uniref:Isoleucine--tRNA ligase n=1 Tax=Selenomonas ruminantium subsp. lactilytica (strain NBRC 103574 / TAM6421) TaxID=927704 RepID=I0GTA8_SELRL|nr:isoleucine--tRNA ligase [Selenomonas ruminantium]BAL83995.1 putative isoleucyl-tRNA synthetase [Selenomonas ruminantium subsp. lactilytica TAM6421]
MYSKVDTNLNFVDREKEVLKFWKDNNIAQKAIDQREGCDTFTFYDGPPTANGKPHIGHVLTRVIKDMLPRYQSMKGKKVLRKAGWDTHGLPVELEVEKLVGINGKEQIEEYGIEPFIKKCRESVWKYKGMWEEFSDVVGFWADMEHPYITYENDFIESEWWALKEIWNKGLLYKGHKVVPYCPRCGTPLSSHEVAQGYKDVKERSAMVKFKVKDEDAYFLAWTTTPWTLPSNLGLCVNPEVDYVKIKVDGTVYYMAEALVESVFEGVEGEREVLERFKGKDLEYREYEPLYDFAVGKIKKKAFFVVCDDYVTTSDGTGIVHLAPAFGEDDNRVCRKYDMPFVQFVNNKGEMTEETDWAGVFVKDADPMIIDDLKKTGKLFKAPKFEHSYPHCWRCDTPLIYYARETWFIKMTDVKDKLIANNNKVNWIPKSIGEGRFGDWLEHVQDWGLSRNRYWGTPLPVWECECGHQHTIGSIAELKEMSDNCPDDIELHRPYIDAVTIKCPECGKEMHRVPEVIDCWFDSGSMPFAQWHYPFENKDIFEKRFPADFISEAVDQTRGWFYSLIAISTLLFDEAPYKNVIVLGHVQDKDGRKMSKSKGNAVDPMEALGQHGADAIRWYFYENSAPWLPNRFHDDAVQEGQRKFMGTLWNTYAFFVLYANIDNFDATKYTLDYDKLPVMDKWVLSRLNTMVKEVDNDLANYKVTEAAKALQAFTDELSNWYVRRSRARFWAKGMEQDKINAYMTLYTALVTTAKAAAPLVPFITESIYRNLVCSIDKNAPESVHLADYPVANEAWIDEELEKNMELVLEIVVLGRASRNETNIKNRQPVAHMYVNADRELSDFFKEIVEDELNVKEVVFKDDMEEYLTYSFKPNFRVLGPKVGKQIGAVKGALEKLNGHKAKAELDSTGKLVVALTDGEVTLTTEDVEVSMAQTEGFNCQRYNGVTIALDTTLTEELLEEGFVREVISKVQTMRKENGFEVTDHIKVSLSGNEKLQAIVAKNEDYLKEITLADSVEYGKLSGTEKEWNINGENITIAVE